ncbi:MAG TPA: hypothetical protein VFF70_11615, partial [Anaerolineae bacterium]|nr:hypothetical protein [Anaerolineae bacterium]
MLPKPLKWPLIAIGGGAMAIVISLGWIGQSAAQGSIGLSANPIDPAALNDQNQTGNLLINPDFESGSTPYPGHNNIQIPTGWNIKWYTDIDAATGYSFFQPEVKLDDNTIWPYCDGCAPNVPPRIHTGRFAVDSFKSYASQDTTLYQQVIHIPIGASVTASAWLHAWVTRCNAFPKNFPPQPAISLYGPNSSLDGSCEPDGTLPESSNRMMVGIDPTGGIDPRAASVVWNLGDPNTPMWNGPYDYYSSTLPVTIFLRGITTSDAKFSDFYFDTASLVYSFPISVTTRQALPWPLTSTVAITLQAPISLTQLNASLADPNGQSIPLTYLGTTGFTPPFISRWEFSPAIAGVHLFTVTAAQLPNPLVQPIDVSVMQYTTIQDHLPPPSPITFTLYSPISLTDFTSVLTDPLGSLTTFNSIGSNYISPTYAFQWTFTSTITG